MIAKPTLESVTTINSDGSRRFIHPADVRGRFTSWRSVVGMLLILVYVSLPWIPINGNPAVFFDVANRQFHLFGLTFVTQDLWLAFFIVSGVGFFLFYVSALFGRIWCGWGCPQTVFLDIARRIERFVEGDSIKRTQLDGMPWTFSKTVRRGFKHLLLGSFALVLSHVFLSYFISLPRLYSMMREAPAVHMGEFSLVFLMGGALWFDFAWFREQFCIVLCPYGRLQSALIDKNSLVIGYDVKRGEPRGPKSDPANGACIDCRRCVQVCPTGIDIRQGLQMECIGCAACVDACDTVMDKLNQPRGLVRYDSGNGLEGGRTQWIRPRIILYTVLMALGISAMSYGVSTLRSATASFVRMTGAPYFLEHNDIRNQFMLRVLNKRNAAVTYHMEFVDAPKELHQTGASEPIEIGPLGEAMRPVVVTLPRKAFSAEFPLKVRLVSDDGRTVIEKIIPFVGPVSY